MPVENCDPDDVLCDPIRGGGGAGSPADNVILDIIDYILLPFRLSLRWVRNLFRRPPD